AGREADLEAVDDAVTQRQRRDLAPALRVEVGVVAADLRGVVLDLRPAQALELREVPAQVDRDFARLHGLAGLSADAASAGPRAVVRGHAPRRQDREDRDQD